MKYRVLQMFAPSMPLWSVYKNETDGVWSRPVVAFVLLEVDDFGVVYQNLCTYSFRDEGFWSDESVPDCDDPSFLRLSLSPVGERVGT